MKGLIIYCYCLASQKVVHPSLHWHYCQHRKDKSASKLTTKFGQPNLLQQRQITFSAFTLLQLEANYGLDMCFCYNFVSKTPTPIIETYQKLNYSNNLNHKSWSTSFLFLITWASNSIYFGYRIVCCCIYNSVHIGVTNLIVPIM